MTADTHDIDLVRTYVQLVMETSRAVDRQFTSSRPKLTSTHAKLPPTFARTRMVDESGDPLVFYHGTKSEFEQFNKRFLDSAGTDISMNYLGFYFTTSPDVARIYVSRKFDPRYGTDPRGRVESFFLNVQNPYYITEHTYWKWGRGSPREIEELVLRLQTRGYDGIVMPSVWRGHGRGSFDVVVFEPEQILKTKGTFT